MRAIQSLSIISRQGIKQGNFTRVAKRKPVSSEQISDLESVSVHSADIGYVRKQTPIMCE